MSPRNNWTFAPGRADLCLVGQRTGDRGRISLRHLDNKEIQNIFAVGAALVGLTATTLLKRDDLSDALAQLCAAVKSMEQFSDKDFEEHMSIAAQTLMSS